MRILFSGLDDFILKGNSSGMVLFVKCSNKTSDSAIKCIGGPQCKCLFGSMLPLKYSTKKP